MTKNAGNKWLPKASRGGRAGDRRSRDQGRGSPQQAAHQGAGDAPPPSRLDDDNPFNFVEWDGTKPTSAENPLRGEHNAWHDADAQEHRRFSGLITVTLRTRSPMFVPEGTSLKAVPVPRPQDFWSCIDADGNKRLGLPGS
jgi:hypothetical protein